MAQSAQEREAIVQRMIDAGEDEDNIATVIGHFKASDTTEPERIKTNVPPPESKPFGPGSPGYAQDESEIKHEPDTYWGGFKKGLTDYFGEAVPGIKSSLESAANPQTTGDFLNLVIPSELPHIARGALSGIANKITGKSRVAEEVLPEISTTSGQLGNIANAAKKPITTQPRPPGPWDSNVDVSMQPAQMTEDKLYDMAREKFNMGRDLPTSALDVKPNPFTPEALAAGKQNAFTELNKPTAEFLGLNQDGTPLFNIIGGEADKSTVGLERLKDLGIEAPEIPANAKPVRGSELRRIALEERAKSRTEVSPDSLSKPEVDKPRFRYDNETQQLIPVEKPALNDIGNSIAELTPQQQADDILANAGNESRSLPEMQQSRSAAMDARNKGFRDTANDFSTSPNEEMGFATKGNEPKNELPGLDPRTKAMLDRNNQVAKMANESQKKGLWGEVRDANRALLTSFDLSALARQGKPLMGTKAYWTSIDDMFKAWGSEKAYGNILESIQAHPNFKQTTNSLTGKVEKSLAQRAGLDIGGAEQFQSNIAERLIPGVRPSERAYNGFLNKLRADHFNTLVDDYAKSGIDLTKDDVKLKALGKFINDATGKGSLGKLENMAPILNDLFFAPKLMASRVNMYKRWLDPRTYSSADPIMRQQAIKSLLATVGFGMAVGELARLGGAQVSNDPTSADFRKAKIGTTRIDPFSGFQQYAVGGSRMLSGESTSTNADKFGRNKVTDLTAGRYGQQTRASVAGQFMVNKLAPVPSLVWSWMSNKDFDGKPFEWKKAMLDRTVPIVMQDLMDIYKSDPKLFPPGIFQDNPTATKVGMGMLPVIGEGVQTYGR